jgi:hypothetical protein
VDEVVLFAFECGESGHTARHCTSTQSTDGNSTNGDVRHSNYCGKNRHFEQTCWLKPGKRVPGGAVRGRDEIRELRRANYNATQCSIGMQRDASEYC